MQNTAQNIHPAAGSPEWHAERMLGIGGSDAPAVLGISRYKTPFELFEEKLGRREPENENWEMARGKALEPLLRQHYADTTGRAVMLPHGAMRHAKYPFITYNPDGLTDDGRLQEFKTAGFGHGWGEEGSDEIPHEYLVQVQQGMAVTGCPVTDVSVSIGGGRPKYFEVLADIELQDMIIEANIKFWECVQTGTPPAPISNLECAQRFSKVNGQSIIALPDIADAMNRLRDTRDKMKALEGDKETLEVIIKSFMGENEVLVGLDGFTPLATWKQQKGSKRIDADMLRANYPDVAEIVTTTGAPQRRFLLK